MIAKVVGALKCVISAAIVTRKLTSGLALAVMVLGLATTANAQQSTGGIKGTVQGADSSVVVEVVDTARGTTKSTVTGSGGNFRFDGLTPGSYEVRVLSAGQVVDSHTVSVNMGGTVTVLMATTEEAIEEIVTTGTRVAALDTRIAESGLIISADHLLELPVQRDLARVAMMAPGVSLGDYRFSGRNGGSGGQNTVSFAGASIAENTSFINGLNTTNFRDGTDFSTVPFEFYETLQIKTGGYSAKYGRSLGGVMNARTKSGSNDFTVGANVYYDAQLDTSPETYIAANDQDDSTNTNFDIFVGGPIIKDRLFYYALYSNQDLSQQYAGALSGRSYDYNIDQGFWGAKIDWFVTDNHHVELTGFSDTRTGVEGTYDFDYATGQRTNYVGDTLYEKGGDNWIATYTGDFTDNIRVAVSYGENQTERGVSSPTASSPTIYNSTNNGDLEAQGDWTAFNIVIGEDKREMTRIDLSWQIGNHSLDFGIDNEVNTALDLTTNSGNIYYLKVPDNDDLSYTGPSGVPGCIPAECPNGAYARIRDYQSGGSFETSSIAYYVQDVWEVSDKLTLELGIRNDSFENLNSDGDVFVKVDDQWAPRFAAVWDPSGDGRQKIFMNYGLYYLPIAANTNIRMSGGETYIQDYYDWDGTSGADDVPTGLGQQFDQDLFGNGVAPDTRSTTDVNIEAMYQSEFILGYQYYSDSGISMGVKGIYRSLETTIEDVAIDAAVISYYDDLGWDTSVNAGDAFNPADPFATGCGALPNTAPAPPNPNTRDCGAADYFGGFHQYVLTNPGNDMNVYIPEQDEYVDLSAEQLLYPTPTRDYAAMEFTFDRPFDGQWAMAASYTWAHSWGNHEGYVKSDNGQDDAGITTNFDQPGLTDHSQGNLPNDRRHTIKAYGSYALENGLRFGASLMWQSGRPLSCFAPHPTDGFASAYGSASHFCDLDNDMTFDPITGDYISGDVEAVPRGSIGTTPSLLNVDLNAQYAMEAGGVDLLFSLDVFNVFNSENATQFNEIYSSSNYGLARQYQRPRHLRLSVRAQF